MKLMYFNFEGNAMFLPGLYSDLIEDYMKITTLTYVFFGENDNIFL